MFTEQWRKLKNERKTDNEQLLVDYKEVFNSEAGKRVLRDIEVKTTFSRSSVSPSKPIDPNRIIYDEGQRSMFLYILKQIHKVPQKKQERTDNG